MLDLNALFAPRSIAVIGAGRERGSVGGEIFHNLLTHAFTGPVYPVNANANRPIGARLPEHQRYLRRGGSRRDRRPARLRAGRGEDCGRKGVKALIVISAGFGETGEIGGALQAKLLATVRGFGMRMVGPNCLGVLTTDPAVRMGATFAPTWPPRGRVSFSSQLGALGLAILDYAKELGIGVRSFVSVGNKADISGNDLIEWWETDPETDVILLYLESFGNPRKLINLARRISKEKPIVAVKSGRTAAGSRAASSHTGALAGEDSAVDALFAQTGVIRTDTIEELFDMSMLLANQPVPASNRLAIVTNAGGPGIMATDACESRGLVVTPLSEATMEKLRGFLPSEASVKNPVDMIASASAESYGKAVRVLLENPQVVRR
jgi:acyl-CoA synthetase (NDP forming)